MCGKPNLPPRDNKCIVEVDYPAVKNKQPVFMYYQLENFYQSNRYLGKSISYKQLSGKELPAD